jgi:hypothetical protein
MSAATVPNTNLNNGGDNSVDIDTLPTALIDRVKI